MVGGDSVFSGKKSFGSISKCGGRGGMITLAISENFKLQSDTIL